MKKAKVKKVFVKILAVILCICATIFCAHVVYVQCHRQEVANYLVEKYGFDNKKIVLLDYNASKFYDNTSMGVPFDTFRSNSNWLVLYNNKKFVVIKNHKTNIMSDDYQLEEIFNWGTEYLQNNINKSIFGFTTNTQTFSKKYDENSIANFFINLSELNIYYKSNDLKSFYNNEEKYDYNDKYYNLKNSVSNKCKINSSTTDFHLFIVSEDLNFYRKLDKRLDNYSNKYNEYSSNIVIKQDTYKLYKEGKLLGE